jgi:hypothetical protein
MQEMSNEKPKQESFSVRTQTSYLPLFFVVYLDNWNAQIFQRFWIFLYSEICAGVRIDH